MLRLICVLAAASVAAACTTAGSGPGAPAQTAAAGDQVCKQVKATGSMMSKTVCRSKADWDSASKTDNQKADTFKQKRDASESTGINGE